MPREPSPTDRPALPSLAGIHAKLRANSPLNPLESFVYWHASSAEFPSRLREALDWYFHQRKHMEIEALRDKIYEEHACGLDG